MKALWLSLGAVFVIALPGGAQGAGFPGKGRYDAWVRACKVFNEANHARGAGRTESAIKSYEKAIAIYPYDADFYSNLGLTYGSAKGQWRRAEELMRRAIVLKPSDPVPRLNLGKILAETGRYGEAITALKEADGLSPTPSQASRIKALMKEIDQAAKK